MKKSKTLACLIMALFALSMSTARADCLGMALHAHRGSNDAPENSLLAVKRAFEGRWDGAEIDVQRLRDQAWILHHDPMLGRTTTLQRRRPTDIDSAAWKEVRLRDRNGKVSDEPAPFLSEVLNAIGDDHSKVLNVEIKEFNANCLAAQQAVGLLASGRPNGQWFLTSIDRAQLQCVRRFDRRGYVGQIVLDPKSLVAQSRFGAASRNLAPVIIDAAWLLRLAREVGAPVGVHLDVATLSANPLLLEHAKAAGVSVYTYSMRGDREHAEGLRAAAARTRLLPSGAVIDGTPDHFCASLGTL